MTVHEWRYFGDRIQYIECIDLDKRSTIHYVVLDGKFHSWVQRPSLYDSPVPYEIRTIKYPEDVTKRQYLTDWFVEVAGGMV